MAARRLLPARGARQRRDGLHRPDGPRLSHLNTRRIYSQTIDSFAAWGEFGWDFADDFTLEGGVRWNWERKRFDFRKIGGSSWPTTDASAREDETWQTPTGQIILTYHIDADKAAYARYTRGFKAGHFNALASETGAEAVGGTFDLPPADEEYNDAWEAGLRGSWLDRRLSLAGSFFYYRYENYQIFLFTDSADVSEPPVLEIVNAKQAENFGVELEGALQPLEGWAPRLLSGLRLSANFSWLHGEYLNFTTFRKFALRSNERRQRRGRLLRQAAPERAGVQGEWHRGVDLRPRPLRVPDSALRHQLERRRVLRPQRGARLDRSDRGAGADRIRRRPEGSTSCTTSGSPIARRPATSRWRAGSATSRIRCTRTTRSTLPASAAS